VLAYLFWHRPEDPGNADEYERRLIEFHAVASDVVVESAAFRLDRLPFTEADGYEDWYLVDDWTALGELNDAAVSGARKSPHDTVAHLTGAGWGGVYRLIRGNAEVPEGGRWESKPSEESYESFLERADAANVWQRQLVLSPAAEFFLSGEPSAARSRVWPR
jgi:hypothetical protein